MSNRDLMLIMHMLYVMLDQDEGEASSKQVEHFKGTLRSLIEGSSPQKGDAASSSEESSAASEKESKRMSDLEERITALEKKNKSLTEELNSHRQMLQMTVGQLDSDLKEANQRNDEACTMSRQLFDKFLDVHEKLHVVMPDSFAVNKLDSEKRSHFMYISNRIGITYIVVVGSPWQGLLAESFRMAVHLVMHQIINEKRFINSSHLIEEFERYYELFEGLGEAFREKVEQVEVSVFIVDKNRFEAEFSSNGPSCCYLYKNTLEEVGGGITQRERVADPLEINKYKTSHLNIREQSRFYISSTGFDDAFVAEGDRTLTLKELVEEINAEEMTAQKEQVSNFFEEFDFESKPDADSLLLGIKF